LLLNIKKRKKVLFRYEGKQVHLLPRNSKTTRNKLEYIGIGLLKLDYVRCFKVRS